MFMFVLGALFVFAALLVVILGKSLIYAAWLRLLTSGVALLLGVVMLIFSTSLWVASDKGGLITKKFGDGLMEGHIIAVNGERGVQAEVLSPGWSFGWAPWLYDLEAVDNINIPEGMVGVVVAMDGQPLPEGEVYAPAWQSPTEMIDAKIFLTKGGCKGPQLTVLAPGQYRYNPRLYTIVQAPCVDVPIGYAAAVRANAGKDPATSSNVLDLVNGVPLVPQGFKGLWSTPLMPNKYYFHPNAYQVVQVRTTKRMYSYTSSIGSEANTASQKEPEGDNSIHVRSSDSFQFPVDVRVAVAIMAQDVPYVVAKIGDPDADPDNNGFDVLEERAILPSIRAILRNSAESKKAIEYVNSRSKVEADCLQKFTVDMTKDKLEVEGFYLADIRLNATPEGQQLLKTQTDTELALQQQAMYKQQVTAEEQRSMQVKAKAAADQQERIQVSLAGIEAEKNNADAARNKAEGEAAQALVYKAKVEAMGGPENFTRLEVTKMLVEKFGEVLTATGMPVLPQILVIGDSSGGGMSTTDGLMTGILGKMAKDTLPEQVAK